jgi:hypothetical protein
MANKPFEMSRPYRRVQVALAALAATIALSTGCAGLDNFVANGFQESPPRAGSVESFWLKQVQYIPDPYNKGTPVPAVVGFVTFFPERANPSPLAKKPPVKPTESMAVEGTLVLELYDDTAANDGQSPKPLARTTYPAKVLPTRLERDQNFGLGYAVAIPWGTHSRDVKQVHVVVHFEPESGGAGLTASSTPMILEHGSPPRKSRISVVQQPPLTKSAE